MELTGQQVEKLHTALLQVFPSKGELEMFARMKLEQPLGTFEGDSLKDLIFHMITWAEAHGCSDQLVAKARQWKPGNPALRDFAASLALLPHRSTDMAGNLLQIYVTDQGFTIHDENWPQHNLMRYLPCLDARSPVKNRRYQKHWRDLGKHVNAFLVGNYLGMVDRLMECRILMKKDALGTPEISTILDGASNTLTTFTSVRMEFGETIKHLPEEFRQTEPVKTICAIPVCLDAVQRSFGSTELQSVMDGIQLARAVGDWLQHSRSIAKAVLGED